MQELEAGSWELVHEQPNCKCFFQALTKFNVIQKFNVINDGGGGCECMRGVGCVIGMVFLDVCRGVRGCGAGGYL